MWVASRRAFTTRRHPQGGLDLRSFGGTRLALPPGERERRALTKEENNG